MNWKSSTSKSNRIDIEKENSILRAHNSELEQTVSRLNSQLKSLQTDYDVSLPICIHNL